MLAYDIPTYVQGHRFSNNEKFYDPTKKYFKDLSGFDNYGNGLVIVNGTPVFEEINGHESVKMDNTWNGNFRFPCLWQGSAIYVVRPKYNGVGYTEEITPILLGDFKPPNTINNGTLFMQAFSGNHILSQNVPYFSTRAVYQYPFTDTAIKVFAVSFDQYTQKAYWTTDGITINEVAAPAASTHGGNIFFGYGNFDKGAIFGAIKRDDSDLSLATEYTLNFFEQHFFSSNILTGSLPQTKEFIDFLHAKYS